jgi:hypothetical protein
MVTFDGFPLGYEVFAGNTHDSRTLQTIVATMEARHGVLGRVAPASPEVKVKFTMSANPRSDCASAHAMNQALICCCATQSSAMSG